MTNLTELLATLKDLEAKATPGPLKAVPAGEEYSALEEPSGLRCAIDLMPEDAKLWAATRNALPTLIQALEEAREAMGYYACPAHYEERVTMGGTRPPGVLVEQGRKARAFLERWGLK